MNNLKNVIKNNKDLIATGVAMLGAAALGAILYASSGEEAPDIHWPNTDDYVDVEFEEFEEVVNDEPTSEEK